jgi:hypothetical protein
VGVVLPLVRPRRLTEPGAVIGSALVTAALVGGLALALAHRPLPPGQVDIGGAASTVLQATPALLQQAIGVFGRTDLALPLAVYVVWGGLVVVGASAALVLGRWRDRLTMLLAIAATAIAAIGAVAFVQAPVGWVPRGSFLLPFLVPVPVIAGFVMHAAGLRARVDALLIGAAVVAVQLLALWENARRYAVGTGGPLNFLDRAQWSPPGGWLPWVVVAAAGGLLVLVALLPLTRGERDEEGFGPLVVVDPISVSR